MRRIDIFPWDDNFNTGLGTVDEQHRRLVAIINDLASQFAFSSENINLSTVFDELLEYTNYHFDTEEGIWNTFLNHEESEAGHRATHTNFVTKLEELIQAQSGRPLEIVAENTLDFLVQWLVSHILESDRYMAYLVKALQDGRTLPEAKIIAEKNMSGHTRHMIDIIMSIYRTLSHNTLRLMREMALQHKTENVLESREVLLRTVIDELPDILLLKDQDGKYILANQTLAKLYNTVPAEMIGKYDSAFGVSQEMSEFFRQNVLSVMEKGETEIVYEDSMDAVTGEVRHFKSIKKPFKDPQGNDQVLVIAHDITDIVRAKNELHHMAHFDILTGLPNRLLLADRLRQAMLQCKRHGSMLAVVYLDLDSFKSINDLYGHDLGDHLLIALSKRIKEALREEDTLSRLGGDEFVAVLQDLHDVDAVRVIVERMLTAASATITISDIELRVSASLGVTYFPQEDEAEPDQLIRQADQAMYLAKQAGKNRYHIFDPEYDKGLRSRHQNIERIRRGLQNDEFVLYYQPKVNMRTGQIIGAEALIRWKHPEEGLLLPSAFLPVIENHPLIIELGDWVIESAIKQILQWHQENIFLPISVNVDGMQLQQNDFVDKIRILMKRYPGILKGELEFEVLETNALEEIAFIADTIHELRDIGIDFALDDFGTGYSSLTYLKRLPANTLKIDQSFVRDLLDDVEDLAIIEGILGLRNVFGRKAIAEGVESIIQGSVLLLLGCEEAQGYAIARPMEASRIPQWMSQWIPPSKWLNRLPLQRDELSMLYAIVEHRVWVDRVCAYLRQQNPRIPVIDPLKCRFGQWLNESGSEYFETEILAGLEQLHHQIHEHAIMLIQRLHAGNTENFESAIEIFESFKEQMSELFFRMNTVERFQEVDS